MRLRRTVMTALFATLSVFAAVSVTAPASILAASCAQSTGTKAFDALGKAKDVVVSAQQTQSTTTVNYRFARNGDATELIVSNGQGAETSHVIQIGNKRYESSAGAPYEERSAKVPLWLEFGPPFLASEQATGTTIAPDTGTPAGSQCLYASPHGVLTTDESGRLVSLTFNDPLAASLTARYGTSPKIGAPETATPTPDASPSPTPEATPSATPEPTPSPTPAPTTDRTPPPTPTPTPDMNLVGGRLKVAIGSTPDKTVAVGSNGTYVMTVTNVGATPLSAVFATGLGCLDFSGATGDDNSNGLLDPGETWPYSCTMTYAATDTGVLRVAMVISATDISGATVQGGNEVQTTVVDPSATPVPSGRTQRFPGGRLPPQPLPILPIVLAVFLTAVLVGGILLNRSGTVELVDRLQTRALTWLSGVRSKIRRPRRRRGKAYFPQDKKRK